MDQAPRRRKALRRTEDDPMAEPFTIGMTRDFLTPEGVMPTADFGQSLVESAQSGARWRLLDALTPEVTAAQVRDLDAVLVGVPRVGADTVRGASRLKLVARLGVGYDNVDLEACSAAGVAATITAGAVDHPMAEGIVTLMLTVTHHILAKDRLMREGRWGDKQRYIGVELRDRVAGFIGFGRIARRTVAVLSAFGMAPPIATDPYVDEATMAAHGVRKVAPATLFAQADFVLVTCSLTPETRGLVGAAELRAMKAGAYLISAARGPIVQQQALVEALRDGRIAGAGLDVFEVEPTDAALPFIALDNVVLSPHAVCYTHELFRDMGRMAFQAALDVAAGTRPHGLLNPEVWDRPEFQRKLRAR